jgi:hypothetical protein
MIRRSSRILLEVVGCLLAGLAILVAVGAWRLTADNPVRLRFLTPYLEDALRAPDGSYSVKIDETVLTWAGWRRQIDLKANGVRVVDATGHEVATVPEIALSVSFRALVSGVIAPRSIEVFGPRLAVIRGEDGRFSLGGAKSGLPDAGPGSILALLVAELQHPHQDGPARYLSEVGIVDGTLTVEDRPAGLTWVAPDADIFLRRTDEGLAAAVDLSVSQLGRPARLAADLIYDSAQQRIDVSARMRGVDAQALGLIDPVLMVLSGADLVLEGNITTHATLDGRIGPTRFELRSGPGQVTLPGQFEAPLAVRGMVVRGEADPALSRISVSDSFLDLDGVHLQVTAQMRDVGNGNLVLSGRIGTATLSMADLKRYWPLNAGPGGRRWVIDNMAEGTAHDADLGFELRVPEGVLDLATIERVAGTLTASGLTVRYLDGLPPVRGGSGSVRFDDKVFVADIAGGAAEDVSIAGGRVVVSELSERDQHIAIEGHLQSTLKGALALLDRPPLSYAAKLGIDSARADGAMATTVTAKFPAFSSLKLSQVDIAAEATLKEAVLGGAILGRDLDHGDLKLRVDPQGMTVEGTANVAGIPSRLTWQEDFGGGPWRSKIALSATTYPDQRKALGLDVIPFLDGPIGAELDYTRYDEHRSDVVAAFDLTRAALALEFLDWRKLAGQKAMAQIEAQMRDGVVVAVPRLKLEAGTLLAQGRGYAVNAKPVGGLAFDRLAVGETDLRDVTVTRTGERIDITAARGVFDAEPLLGRERGERAMAAKAGAAVERVAAPSDLEPEGTAFTVRTASLDRVLLGRGRELNAVRLGIHYDGRHWQEIQLDAHVGGGGPLAMRYLPDGPGQHRLTIGTQDAGGLLRLLGVSQSVIGGRLAIDAVSDDSEPQRPLRGRAIIREFRMFKAPLLARMLTIATFTGLVDALTGEGFLFDRFIADFTRTGSRIDIALARAYGPSLGITAEGWLDTSADTVELRGTLIPLFAFNNILASIPLIGDLLTAGEGGGIFAATYRAAGSLEDPKIRVNPLAALAPGVLRQLFDFGGVSVSRGAPPPPPGLQEGSRK